MKDLVFNHFISMLFYIFKEREMRDISDYSDTEVKEMHKLFCDEWVARFGDEIKELAEDVYSVYPKRPNDSKAKAIKAITARLRDGEDHIDMIEGADRYRAYCVSQGHVNPETGKGNTFVKQAATFYGPNKHYNDDYTIEKPLTKMNPSTDINDTGWAGHP